jgi:hypothetical protein
VTCPISYGNTNSTNEWVDERCRCKVEQRDDFHQGEKSKSKIRKIGLVGLIKNVGCKFFVTFISFGGAWASEWQNSRGFGDVIVKFCLY